MSPERIIPGGVGLALIVALLAPGAAHAQGGDGFLFKQPRVTVQMRLGYDIPLGPRTASGEDDIFAFTQDLLTIGDSDHDAFSIGGEIGVRVSDRVDVVLDLNRSKSEVRSEFRDWVDTNDLPIEQTTSFTRQSFALSGRYFLRDRGTTVGRFAWVPTSWTPYLGGGVGLLRYEFLQDGDFVDFETLDIFSAELVSSDNAFMGHVMAGLQYSLGAQWVMTGEARYRFASSELSRDFVSFDDINLTGLSATVGFGIRF